MADPTQTVMILPRYSSLVGATTFYSAPISVRAFSDVVLTIWRGSGVNVSGFALGAQLSPDMEHWLSEGSIGTVPANEETELDVPLDREWMRVSVTLVGTNAAAPLWIEARLLVRGV